MIDVLIGRKPEIEIPFRLDPANQHVLYGQETIGGYHGRCVI